MKAKSHFNRPKAGGRYNLPEGVFKQFFVKTGKNMRTDINDQYVIFYNILKIRQYSAPGLQRDPPTVLVIFVFCYKHKGH